MRNLILTVAYCILLLCFIACIMACEDNHHADEDPQIESYVRDNFFNPNFISDKNESIGNANKLKSSFKIIASQEDLKFREQIMSYYHNKIHYAQQIKDKVGLPVWDHIIYNTFDVDKLAFIPCAKENSIYTEGLIIVLFSKEKNKLLFNYVDRYNFDGYLNPLVEMNCENIPDRTYIMSLFLIFDKLFNYSDCDILDELTHLLNIERETRTKKIDTSCEYFLITSQATKGLEVSINGEVLHHEVNMVDEYDFVWVCRDVVTPDIIWGNNTYENGGGSSSGSGNGPKEPDSDEDKNPEDPNPAPPVIEDNSWKNTKADCVKEKLETGGNNSILNKLLKGFNLSRSTVDLTFYVGNTDYRGNSVPNGKCIFDPNTNRMSVYISEDRLSASSLEVARTILHECFHTYMYGKLYEKDIHKGLAPEPDFQNDFMNYSNVHGSSGGPNSAQHNYMATMYIQYMKEGLNNFFNSDPQYMEYASNYSSNDNWDLDSMLEGLAWQGLHGTDAWKDFKTNNPDKVNNFNMQISLFVNDYDFPKDCD